jgi:DNA-directed RNA polymerase II subunit RPB1
MTIFKELDYKSEISSIIGLQFSVSGPDEIRKKSVVNVTQAQLYDTNGDPIINGLFDPRMGVIDNGKICPTDELDNRFCPGYFGHIELAKPVFHHQFLDITLKAIKCFCQRCSSILIDKDNELYQEYMKDNDNRKRFSIFYDIASKAKECPQCGFTLPSKYVKEGLAKIYGEWKESGNREYFSAERVHRIFRKITDEDAYIMGFTKDWCRPDWLICTVLPVAPPAVRPSIKQFNGMRSEDDITHKLVDIVKTNITLSKRLDKKETSDETIEGFIDLLQYHVATLVDNQIPHINVASHRSGRPLKTISERLKGKEGRIRGNLMGKRVDFSARTVITPDPNIKIDQLGVPFKIAMNLTFPEIVNRFNIHKLTKCIRNGTDVHPGAKSVKQVETGNTFDLRVVDGNSIELKDGDIVHRHLMDDDNVLFNRQPSLHKMSMMAHRVKVMKHNTFRLNVSVTKPYNADFDGDEMNMHVPQSIQTSVELNKLARVPSQIISPRMNGPVISPVQDTLLGIYRITNDNVYFNELEMMEMLMTIESFDGNLPEPEINKGQYQRWTGRQLISLILPCVNMNMGNGEYDDSIDDKLNYVKIKDGVILQGRFDKKIVSSGTNGLVHMIFNDFGEKACQRFLDNIQDIITRYLLKTGFSVGISDLIADEITQKKMEDTIVKNKKEVSEVIQHIHLNIFENESGKDKSIEFEDKINNILNKTSNDAGKIGLKSLDPNNRMTNMVKSGSKGSNINISQMISCLGQQNVDGKRIPYGFTDRTLPHYLKYDDSPEGRGFVENSFIRGLTPQEFFFHAMGGREGLIDTAVKTSETGYIQRKLIKAMEDLKVSHDLSVKNAGGKIVQFIYGEDGYNYAKIESQYLDFLELDFNRLQEKHRFNHNEKYDLYMEEETIDEMKKNKSFIEDIDKFYMDTEELCHILRGDIFKNNFISNVNYPINLKRLVNHVISLFNIEKTDLSDLSPLFVIEKIHELEDYLKIEIMDEISLIFKSLIYSYLSPKHLIKNKRMSKLGFEHLINMIKVKYHQSFISTGEMVGAIAAQSIGEPATQMTLNTFHFAGVGSKSNVTRGVPRLKELLHISKNLKMPSVTVYLKDEFSGNVNTAQSVANNLEYTLLKNIVCMSSIYYDPSDDNTAVPEDNQFMEIYKLFNEIDPVENEVDSRWVLRLEFDRKELMNKNISMDDIYIAIFSIYKDEVSSHYTDDNAGKIIFRMRVKIDGLKNDNRDIIYLKNFEKTMLENVVIKGINKIESVNLRSDKNNTVFEDGEYKMKEKWILDTNGTNLIEILSHPSVDYTRTYSNDIVEVYNLLGIDAAKKLIFKEINEVLDFSGSYVNYRHLSLLCDTMTNKGKLMSIDRFGINRDRDIGPLAKCSFEETTDQIFKASIYGEIDKLDGVSANIMMGQIIPAGTGESMVFLDEMKLLDVKPKKKKIIKKTKLNPYCSDNLDLDLDVDTLEPDTL